MKSFLTIRGNLLLINLVVIGLILWLAISFLHIAVMQRNDALRLQANVNTEKTIFQANNTLAHERDIFDNYLNSPNGPTAQRFQQLETAGFASDAMLDKMIAQVTHQIAEHQIFEHMSTTRPILQKQMDGFKRHRTKLVDYRKYSLSQYLLPADSRDRVMPSILFSRQTGTIEELISLAKRLKYLPNTNASAIAHYHELLNEILLINVELARKNTALNKKLFGNREISQEEQLQIALLSQKIEQRLADIVSLTQASDNIAQLMPIATQAQRFYQTDYVRATNGIRSDNVSQGYSEKEQSERRLAMSTLSSMTAELAQATHASIEILVDNYGTRANRNLVIDVFLVILCFAITLASVAINRRIKQYAFHDSLTQLPNRLNFEAMLLNSSAPGSKMQAVIFIDLDRFKSINDNYGHSIGDELLVEIASRLKAICKPSHLLARLGGDEFAVFIDDVQSEDTVEAMASKIVAAIKNNIVIRDLSLNVGASVGFSISPLDCECGIELLKNADIAMYHSKANKLNEGYRFTQELAADYHQRLQLEADLRKGVENNEFQLVYQPKVCTHTGQIKSVEALLRWVHPEWGFVSPAQFIPVAEDAGLMGTIGQWVLNEACREIALLQQSTFPQLKVAVNISAQQFCDVKFVDSVYSALSKYGLDHESLELEVTESLVMTNVEHVISMLKTLKNSGVTIAIDDFGTGYSSLQYLQELPLNTLKIDRAFIIALDDSDPASSVANSIVQLAKLFDLETVAEGVETDVQDLKIRSLGVHHIQGYLYSKPVSASDLPDAIQSINQQVVKSATNQQRAA